MLVNPETISTAVQRQVLAHDWPNALRALKRTTFSSIMTRTHVSAGDMPAELMRGRSSAGRAHDWQS